METILSVATVASIALVGIVSPGPDFLAVSYAAVAGSRQHARAVAAGVVIGNGIWAGAALVGVGTLFTLFPSLFVAIKVFGALYLMWLGVRLLRNARKPLPDFGSGPAPTSMAISFAKGLSTTMSNPKAAIYYASALTTAAPPSASWTILLMLLFAVIVVAAIWFIFVVEALTRPTAANVFRKFKVYFETIFGVLLLSFGLRQIITRAT